MIDKNFFSIENLVDSNSSTQNPDAINLSQERETNTIAKSSVDDLVSLCLSSVQHLEDMKFNLSNTKTDGEEFVRIELLIPRKSFAKGNEGSHKGRKEDNEKVIIKTSNSIRKNQQVNSSAQCIDQNTTSKRRFSYDLKKSIRKNSNSEKLPAIQEVHEGSLGTESLHSSVSEKTGSLKRNLMEEEWKSSNRCGVCGDKASKFIHYGGRSCQSCRAFFRRTVAKSNK